MSLRKDVQTRLKTGIAASCCAGLLMVSLISTAPLAAFAATETEIAAADSPAASITKAMPIIITELAVKTENGTVDGKAVNIGEFIELHNMSAEAIPVSDLTVNYNGVDWTPSVFAESTATIPSQGNIVLWSNYANASKAEQPLTKAEDFNAFWLNATGTNPELIMGETLFPVDLGAGMANGSPRTLIVTQKSTGATNTVSYDDGGTTNNKTLVYTYDETGSATMSKENLGTPGSTIEGQLPQSWPTPGGENPDPGNPDPENPDPENPVLEPAAAPLFISEIKVASSKASGSDAYEFIEVYNVSDRDVDFSDGYSFYYSYPDKGESGDVNWNPTETDITIPAGKAAVFWIKNGPNDAFTADDFNNEYSLSGADALTMGENLFQIHSAGMSNSAARYLKVTTATRKTLNQAYYPDKATGQTGTTKSFHYSYQGKQTDSSLRGVDLPTPGTVPTSDVQAKTYEFPTGAAISVTDNSPTEFGTGEDITISVNASTENWLVHRATLQYKRSEASEYTAINLTSSNDSYTHKLSAVDLLQTAGIDYYFEFSDGIGEPTATEVRTISATNFDNRQIRLNVNDGDYLRQTVPVRATPADPTGGQANLNIDGQDIPSSEIAPSLETEPVIAVDVTATDIFFLNSFTKNVCVTGTADGDDWKENVIGVFDDGTYDATKTVSFDVPLDMVKTVDGKTTVSLYFNAGTKSSPTDIVCAGDAQQVNPENADDFSASNLRLQLPDGTSLQASKASAAVSPGTSGSVDGGNLKDVTAEVRSGNLIKMGDSVNKYEYIYLEFEVPTSAMSATAYQWDTTKVNDGQHVIKANRGEITESATVTVDNTNPVIIPNFIPDSTKRGGFTIDAKAEDATSGIAEGTMNATLRNGEGKAQEITLPYQTSSLSLPAGTHTVTFTVKDQAGNETTKQLNFNTPNENPQVSKTDGKDGDKKTAPFLNVFAADESGDELSVEFKRGESFNLGDKEIVTSAGETTVGGLDASEQLEAATLTGEETAENGGFPYQAFTVAVPQLVKDDETASTTVRWSGTANAGADVYSYVLNATEGTWEELNRTQADEDGNLNIEVNVPLKDHVKDGEVTVIVQNGSGYAGSNYGTGGSASNGTTNGEVITRADSISQEEASRESYDFTFAWESDTQYYNANYDNNGFYKHQENIHKWLLANREKMNIQYLFHTGDIVDLAEDASQWERADSAYQKLDEAGLPYGVLAGNHDVGHKTEDYNEYYKYFPASRYDSNPWYGGTYENNRGHYDLVTAGGVDFIMVYAGWGVGADEIEWMNSVLAQYPDRVAILNFHEYLLASGGLGLIPQTIYSDVVAKNDNVKMVLSGHYHSAQTTVSTFPTADGGTRNVVNMLFDYQAMAEGGLGYLRLLHVNTAEGTMRVRTFSASNGQYGSQNESSSSFTAGDEEFVIDLNKLGIDLKNDDPKTINTTALTTDFLSNKVIGSAKGVLVDEDDAAELAEFRDLLAGGSQIQKASIEWKDAAEGRNGWYAVITNSVGGQVTTPVSYVSAVAAGNGSGEGPGNGGGNGNGNGNGTGNGGGTNSGNASGSENGGGQTTASGMKNSGRNLAKTGATVAWIVVVAGSLAAAGTVLLRRKKS